MPFLGGALAARQCSCTLGGRKPAIGEPIDHSEYVCEAQLTLNV